MGLEVATTIDQLNPNWPLPTDKRREGDDHLRVIKESLQGSFPELVGSTIVTKLMLDELPETGFASFLTELLKHVMPTGGIIEWSGAVGDIPAGWVLCDGTNGTPDLRNRFIIGAGTGAGGTLAVGATGGANTATSTSTSPGTGQTTDAHVLTQAELPNFDMPIPSGARFVDTAGTSDGITGGTQAGHRNDSALTINFPGGGGEHTHPLPALPHTHDVTVTPPYYALAYIKKTSVFTMPELP